MALERLVNTAPATEALVRIYEGRIVLNSRAVSLLKIPNGGRIDILCTPDQPDGIRRRLFIGSVTDGGFRTSPKGRGAKVCSAPLSRSMAQNLDGYGTYKISEVDTTRDVFGRTQYLIWWRKYDRL